MNTAQKLRKEIGKIYDGEYEYTYSDKLESKLQGYLKALDELMKEIKLLVKDWGFKENDVSLTQKDIEGIVKELRG